MTALALLAVAVVWLVLIVAAIAVMSGNRIGEDEE